MDLSDNWDWKPEIRANMPNSEISRSSSTLRDFEAKKGAIFAIRAFHCPEEKDQIGKTGPYNSSVTKLSKNKFTSLTRLATFTPRPDKVHPSPRPLRKKRKQIVHEVSLKFILNRETDPGPHFRRISCVCFKRKNTLGVDINRSKAWKAQETLDKRNFLPHLLPSGENSKIDRQKEESFQIGKSNEVKTSENKRPRVSGSN